MPYWLSISLLNMVLELTRCRNFANGKPSRELSIMNWLSSGLAGCRTYMCTPVAFVCYKPPGKTSWQTV
jgi:hypothetical protein